jgi:serine/threonine protein kinase
VSTPPETPAEAHAIPGTILAGKYRVERVLGKGGMGLVLEARHLALDERVALKFLLPEFATDQVATERFLREARASVKIKSEHVARVSDVGTLETGAPYMVMEFLEGSDLSKVLQTHGVLQVSDAVDFLIQGCEAIAEAHSYGIVHRDMKPANLFLTHRPDGTPLVKVLDFGISKHTGSGVDNLTSTTMAMGSALYMSPEQMKQTRSVDHRTDIYALGIALYELLAGKQPFFADSLPQLCAEILTGTPAPLCERRPDIPPQLAAVIERAYERERDKRYQSIAEFVIALAPYAPARSQSALDRIARMAGLEAPIVGRASNPPDAPAWQRPSSPPPYGQQQSQPQLHQSQPQLHQSQPPFHQPSQPPFHQPSQPPFHQPSQPPFHQPSQPPFHQASQPPLHQSQPSQPPFHQASQPPFSNDTASAWARTSAPSGAPAPLPTQPGPAAVQASTSAGHDSSPQILVPGYAGPMSMKASAAFAAGKMPAHPPERTGGKTLIIASVAFGTLALIGLVAVVILRPSISDAPSGDVPAAPGSSVPIQAAPPAATPAEAAKPTPVVEPVGPSAAAATAPPPTATTEPTASAADKPPVQGATAATIAPRPTAQPVLKPTAAPKPSVTGKGTNEPPPVLNER